MIGQAPYRKERSLLFLVPCFLRRVRSGFSKTCCPGDFRVLFSYSSRIRWARELE